MAKQVREAAAVVRDTIRGFTRDNCLQYAASLAFFTLFSLAPILVLALDVLGLIVRPELLEGEIRMQIATVVGPEAAEQVRVMVAQADARRAGGLLPQLGSLLVMLIAATMVLAQLQTALNAVWHVAPDPERPGYRILLLKRVLSLAMIVAFGVLLLLSLALSTGVQLVSQHAREVLPDLLSVVAIRALDLGLSFTLVAGIVVLLFKVVPEAQVAWRDALVGGLVTAALFLVGRGVIAVVLTATGLGSAYGAASSLAVILLWVFYTSILLLAGAEFTKVRAQRRGREVKPGRGAVRVERRFGDA